MLRCMQHFAALQFAHSRVHGLKPLAGGTQGAVSLTMAASAVRAHSTAQSSTTLAHITTFAGADTNARLLRDQWFCWNELRGWGLPYLAHPIPYLENVRGR